MSKSLEKLKQLLKQKKSKDFYASKLNVSISEVERMIAEIKGTSSEEFAKHDVEKGTFEVKKVYTQAPTADQIIKDHNMDMNKWKLSLFWSKQKSDGTYIVSALFKQISIEEDKTNKFIDFISNYSTTHIPNKTQIINNNFDLSCALISLTDFHIDKKNITKETIEDKINNYRKVLNNLLNRTYNSSNIEEIVFVIGNDFFQTDTIQGTTTSGTPVDYDNTWNEAYEKGFDLMVESIIKVKSFCKKLHIVLVQGNHARTKEFYLAHALEVFFKNDKNITFDRTSNDLKIYKYGETMMCFHHGDCINDKLPLAFATSFYKEWGECKFKEILLGDKHYNSQKIIKNMGEDMGVRMRILPAITGTDAWHKKNLFINSQQAGICLVYDKIKGKISEFEERI